MDKKTQYYLDRMGRRLPKRLMDKLVKKVPTEEYTMAMEILSNKNVSSETKRKIVHSIQSGTVKSHEDVVDSKTQKELDHFMERGIKTAVKSGRIAPPKDDSFTRKMRKATSL